MSINLGFRNPFTKIYHKKPYALIDPTQAKLSAAGKTVLITAGHTGIGYSISQNFALAGAANVVLIGRRADILHKAVKELSVAHPNTKFHSVIAAIGNNDRIKEALRDIRSSISPDLDILVTSAVHINPTTTTLKVPFEGFAESITTNIIGNAYLVREFLGDPAILSPSKEKIIIDVASMAVHTIMNVVGSTYGVSKLGFTQWLAHLSEEMENKGVKIHSMHPGAILTEAARASGHDENTVPWDDAQLPGQMAVWLASKESDFLKGRFIWANWDVEEMMERKSEFEGNSDLLRFGLMH